MKNLTNNELSLKYYQDNGFYFINTYLRENIFDEKFISKHKINYVELEKIKNHIKNIDELFLEKSKKSSNLVVYRGINSSKIYQGKDLGYVSTSLNFDIAKKFAGTSGIIYELLIDNNVSYLDCNLWNNNENEIILERNLNYTIVSTKKINKNIIYIMSVSVIS